MITTVILVILHVQLEQEQTVVFAFLFFVLYSDSILHPMFYSLIIEGACCILISKSVMI